MTPGRNAAPAPGSAHEGRGAHPAVGPSADAIPAQGGRMTKQQAAGLAKTLPPLSCGGCKKCCRGDTITLMEGDDPTRYKTRLVDGRRVLRRRKDGDCIYLGSKGCTIWPGQPRMCRAFDCRTYALGIATMDGPEQAERLQRASCREGIARLAKLGHDVAAYGLPPPDGEALA